MDPDAGVVLRVDQFLVTGAVRRPGTVVSTAELDRRARGPERVHYVTRACDRFDEVHGIPLHDLLSDIGLLLREGRKMDQLNLAVLARGQDGYQVTLSWGEVDVEFGACAALLATRYNNVPLPRPTLVLPRDTRGSRYVRLLSELRVVHVDADADAGVDVGVDSDAVSA
ncbi:molybdopterin-binding protein [Amycolatopsis sp. H20-H5]|uniref:molybdopterin-binding protein n=1 Tax=Amycolatopsis sp. H20-H5 TaxID=3046309 RepID=UPI002DBDFAE4|nr:molybdopterin-binding protein [Amycolatopsis sp. H20-H5]MEC3981470.1 molybdopterin-binding protein [Amycolatopsis sp. H20-H5]